MLFDLIIAKFKYLKSIRESSLGCFGFSKVIYHFLIREGLLNIIIVKVYNCVSIWECLSSDTIAKYYLFFTIQVCSLDLTIVSNNLVLYICIIWIIIMIDMRHFHFKIIFLFALGSLIFYIIFLFLVILNILFIVHDFFNLIFILFEFHESCCLFYLLFWVIWLFFLFIFLLEIWSLWGSSISSIIKFAHYSCSNTWKFLLLCLLIWKLWFPCFSQLLIIMSNFISEFLILLPQITALPWKSFNLRLLVFFFLSKLFFCLWKLFP